MSFRLEHSSDDLERLREEKDQEIAILQEGMDTTIMQLSDAQQVGSPVLTCTLLTESLLEPRHRR
jgi:hypothetical protein